jgi:predicted TIM-barrel fold metal-dependent hydrolase
MVIDFEHHYIPAELGQRVGMDPARKEGVRTRDAFVHFGGGLAGYKERIARSSYRFKLPRSFEDYFDRLYFDMAGFEGSPIALRCALEAIRPERMIFATDYPQNFNNTDPKQGRSVDGIGDYIEDIRRLPLDSSVKDGMLGHTAARLLKIAQ